VSVALPDGIDTDQAGALIEGIWLGDYRFERFRSNDATGDRASATSSSSAAACRRRPWHASAW
jgi:Leucyl aminopeptidase